MAASREEMERRLQRRGGGIAAGARRTQEAAGLTPGVLQTRRTPQQVAMLERQLALGGTAPPQRTRGFTNQALNAGPEAGTGALSTAVSPQTGGTTTEVRGGETVQRRTGSRQSASVPSTQAPGNQALSRRRGAAPALGQDQALAAPELGGFLRNAQRPQVGGQSPLRRGFDPNAPPLRSGGRQPRSRISVDPNRGGALTGQIRTPQGSATFQYGSAQPGARAINPARFGTGGVSGSTGGRTAAQQAAIDQRVASLDRATRNMEINRLMRRNEARGGTGLTAQEQARINELQGLGRTEAQQRGKQRTAAQQAAFDQNLALREQARKEAGTQQGAARLGLDFERLRQERDNPNTGQLDPVLESGLEAYDTAQETNALRAPEDQVDAQQAALDRIQFGLRATQSALMNGQRVPLRDIQAMADRDQVSLEDFARANGIILPK